MPAFELTETFQKVTLRTPELELSWSSEDGALRVLRRLEGLSVIGHGPAVPAVDVALGSASSWLAERSFVRYLSHHHTFEEDSAEVTIVVGLGPLVIHDVYRVTGALVTRQVMIENVSLDAVQIHGLRLLVPYARIGRAETCHFEAPSSSVRPHVPLEIAASQRRNVSPRRFFAPGLRGGSALELAPTHGPGLLVLHTPPAMPTAAPVQAETLLCWYFSAVETALPFLEGRSRRLTTEPVAVSLGHEVAVAAWLNSEDRITCGTQSLLLLDKPWAQAQVQFRQSLALQGVRPPPDQPDWVRDAVIYETHPALFGGFAALTRTLPELVELGFTTLLLLPVWEFARPRERLWDGNWNHSGSPYAIRDFERIDATLGTPRELRALVDKAHNLGLRVLFDLALRGCAANSRYVQEQPHWFCRDPHGTFATMPHPLVPSISRILPPGCYSFDWNNSDLHSYFAAWALDLMHRYDLDGFRVTGPYNPISNWMRRLPYHASAASMGLLPFLRRLRESLHLVKTDAALICDMHGPIYTEMHDACADYLVHHMFVYLTLNQITPAELGEYLHDHRATLPPGSTRIGFMETHDTCDVNPLADGLRGSRLSRMAIAGMIFCGFVPALWAGQERGEEMVLRELLRVWHESAELRYGETFYNAVACDSPHVFAVVRVLDGSSVLGLLNVGPHKRTVTLSLPVDLMNLADGCYHLHELISDISWTEEGRETWGRDELRQFQLTLDPYGSYCVAIEAAEHPVTAAPEVNHREQLHEATVPT